MDVEDIVRMMESINVNLADPLGGYIYYLMGCYDATKITAEEFQRLTDHLKVNTLAEFKKKVPTLRKEFDQK